MYTCHSDKMKISLVLTAPQFSYSLPEYSKAESSLSWLKWITNTCTQG